MVEILFKGYVANIQRIRSIKSKEPVNVTIESHEFKLTLLMSQEKFRKMKFFPDIQQIVEISDDLIQENSDQIIFRGIVNDFDIEKYDLMDGVAGKMILYICPTDDRDKCDYYGWRHSLIAPHSPVGPDVKSINGKVLFIAIRPFIDAGSRDIVSAPTDIGYDSYNMKVNPKCDYCHKGFYISDCRQPVCLNDQCPARSDWATTKEGKELIDAGKIWMVYPDKFRGPGYIEPIDAVTVSEKALAIAAAQAAIDELPEMPDDLE